MHENCAREIRRNQNASRSVQDVCLQRRHFVGMANNGMNVVCKLPNLDKDGIWFSISTIISRVFKTRRVLYAVVNRMEDQAEFKVLEVKR